jgi:hypothetical protein
MLTLLKNRKNKCSICQFKIKQNETLAYYQHITKDKGTGNHIDEYQRLYICDPCFTKYEMKKKSDYANIVQCKCGMNLPIQWQSYHKIYDCLSELLICDFCKKSVTRFEHNNDQHNCNGKLLQLIQDQSVQILCLTNKVDKIEFLIKKQYDNEHENKHEHKNFIE